MSQLKASLGTQPQPNHANSHGQEPVATPNRILTRRSGRTTATAPLKDDTSSLDASTTVTTSSTINNSAAEVPNRMTTRSRASIDSSNKETSHPSAAQDTTKKPRATKTATKSGRARPPKAAPPPPASRQRSSRKRTRKDAVPESPEQAAAKKQKLADLDELEKTIKDETHPELLKRYKDLEQNRIRQIEIAQRRRQLDEDSILASFEASKKAASDEFISRRAALRTRMIDEIQGRIKRLEEEWQAQGYLNHDQLISDWTPQERHPSILHFEPLGLSQNEITQDLAIARTPYDIPSPRYPEN